MNKKLTARCNRCGRPLSNLKSIFRGYGPVCWSRITHQNNLEEYLEKGALEDNNYPEITEYFDLLNTKYKCDCGEFSIKYGEIDHYEHDDGYHLNGYKNKQWIFIVCPKCKIAISFKRLGIEEI